MGKILIIKNADFSNVAIDNIISEEEIISYQAYTFDGGTAYAKKGTVDSIEVSNGIIYPDIMTKDMTLKTITNSKWISNHKVIIYEFDKSNISLTKIGIVELTSQTTNIQTKNFIIHSGKYLGLVPQALCVYFKSGECDYICGDITISSNTASYSTSTNPNTQFSIGVELIYEQ